MFASKFFDLMKAAPVEGEASKIELREIVLFARLRHSIFVKSNV
jgi:hypothetical protein